MHPVNLTRTDIGDWWVMAEAMVSWNAVHDGSTRIRLTHDVVWVRETPDEVRVRVTDALSVRYS